MSARAAELQLVQGKLRVLRAGVFSACAVSLAAAAHVLAGGAAPAPFLLLTLGLLLAPPAAVAAGRLRGAVPVGGTMIAVQAALHWLFGVFSGTAATCAQMSAHLGHPGEPSSMVCHGGPMTMAEMGTSSPLMTLAHLAAAGMLGLLLSRGENALWRMLSWILRKLPGRFRPFPATSRPRRAVARRALPLSPDPLAGAVGRRGPPRRIAIFA
ncbi:hypothetical protein Kisp01_06130 [Kineosporia sp. NBRC 101677]|uniref:hypothetical protein n=1 Tax=Kineosporia sp. NBRC 101677 TaxID=3032197 RepID=UPI0024A1DDF4|nr:hypothetical protein [Kineosporia sp. NBRC 101677]GLY13597.1 hypothetical protein Kisp01_06130 [Kineosporia sp. NBRC 101677]